MLLCLRPVRGTKSTALCSDFPVNRIATRVVTSAATRLMGECDNEEAHAVRALKVLHCRGVELFHWWIEGVDRQWTLSVAHEGGATVHLQNTRHIAQYLHDTGEVQCLTNPFIHAATIGAVNVELVLIRKKAVEVGYRTKSATLRAAH